MDNETVSTGEEDVIIDDAGDANVSGDGKDVRDEAETQKKKKAREERETKEREFRAKKRRLIPPFVMLSAGAITSITMRVLHYEMKTMLIILLCVLIGFYIAGGVIKYMLDIFEKQIEEAGMEEGEVIEKELAEEEGTEKNSEANKRDE